MPVNALDPDTIKARKGIYEHVLAEALLHWTRHLQDQIDKRAKRQPDFRDRVYKAAFKTIKGVLSDAAQIVPIIPAGVAKRIVKIIGQSVIAYREHMQEKRIETLGTILYAKNKDYLQTLYDQAAREASLRYEHAIVSLRDTAGVITLARIGAKRIMDYLCNAICDVAKDHEESLDEFPVTMEWILSGLFYGRSGKGIDGFRDNYLLPRDTSEKLLLTAEGIYGRSAMCLLEASKTFYTNGKASVFNGLPKYYTLMDGIKIILDIYEYTKEYTLPPEAIYYSPTVKKISADDIYAYNNTDKKNTFLEFIRNKYNNNNIYQIWVRGAISNVTLKGGDYSGVDFFGCTFNAVTIEDANFSHANFSLVQACDFTCRNVNFTQVDFSCANLCNVTFTDVNHMAAKWRGVILEDVHVVHADTDRSTDQSLVKDIKNIQEQQEKDGQEVNGKIFTLHDNFRKLERSVDQKYKEIQNQNAGKITELFALAKQEYLQLLAFKLYCETHIAKLEVIGRDHAAEIERLNQQMSDIASNQEEIHKTLDNIYKEIKGLRIDTEDKIKSIQSQFIQVTGPLRQQLNGVTARIGKVETRIYELETRLEALEKKVETLEGILTTVGNVLLVGEAASGKSVVCRQLAAKSPNNILLDLNKIKDIKFNAEEEELVFREFLLRIFNKNEDVDNIINHPANFRFILDGYDRIASRLNPQSNNYNKHLAFILKILHKKCNVMITSRPTYFGDIGFEFEQTLEISKRSSSISDVLLFSKRPPTSSFSPVVYGDASPNKSDSKVPQNRAH